jgi:formiminoglutamase
MRFVHSPELLFSRGEPEDPRLGDIATLVQAAEFVKHDWDVTLIGFPDDRGVSLNRGRPGAASGPAAIRKWLYRLVAENRSLRLADLGDLTMTADLHHDHEVGTQAIAFALARSRRVVILGGGHDWGYCPISALAKSGRTGFVNLDAHLDVRASEVQHSGTSYWRALEKCVEGVDAVWYGVQPSATASLHTEYVDAKFGKVFMHGSESTSPDSLRESINALASRCDHVDLSLDLDVFAMAYAPGVSAPQPMGLTPKEAIEITGSVLAIDKVRTFGVYELAPPVDESEATARLAARCVWETCR